MTALRDTDTAFERHLGNHKLKIEDVAFIRRGHASLNDIAERFGIFKSTASYVRNERIWVPVPLGETESPDAPTP